MSLIFKLDVFILYLLKILFFAEGQPESIVEDIENMVRSYIEKVIMPFVLSFKKLNIEHSTFVFCSGCFLLS